MFRLWGKIVKSNKTLRDTVIEDNRPDTRTHKILNGLTEICYRFDLSVPIWLDSKFSAIKAIPTPYSPPAPIPAKKRRA